MFLPRREFDSQVDSLHDDGVGSAIKVSKSDQCNWVGIKFVFEGESGVNETVSRAGVNQSLEGMVGDGIGDERCKIYIYYILSI